MSSVTPLLDTVVVTGEEMPAPVFYATPTLVDVPAGDNLGDTTVYFNTAGSGYPSSCIWIQSNHGQPNSGAVQLWSCNGQSGSHLWTYVPNGGTTTFWLAPGSESPYPHIGTITVTGQ